MATIRLGSGMHTACTAFDGNVVTNDYKRLSVKEGMLSSHVLKLFALDLAYDLILFDLGCLHGAFDKLIDDDIGLVSCLDKIILESGAYADSNVAGQGPCGGCPDNEICIVKICAKSLELALIVSYLELYIDGEAGILTVLDFRLCKGGLTVGAPVNGLEAAVDMTVAGKLCKELDLLLLKLGKKGDIGIVPLTDITDSLELLSLVVDVAVCKLCAELTELNNRNVVVNACLCSCLKLGGKTVGIPAGNIRRTEAVHVLVSYNKVLEGLVKCMTKMDIAVCIGRAIVKNKLGLTLIHLDKLLINVHFLPASQHIGLSLRKVCSHGKFRFEHIKCRLIILCQC